jgi:hypothetical protein
MAPVTLPTSIAQNNEEESDVLLDSPLHDPAQPRKSESGAQAEPLP